MNDAGPDWSRYNAQIQAYLQGASGFSTSSSGSNSAFYRERYGDWPEDPDDGSAGVREPRRPLPSAPAAAAEVEILL